MHRSLSQKTGPRFTAWISLAPARAASAKSLPDLFWVMHREQMEMEYCRWRISYDILRYPTVSHGIPRLPRNPRFHNPTRPMSPQNAQDPTVEVSISQFSYGGSTRRRHCESDSRLRIGCPAASRRRPVHYYLSRHLHC